MTHLHIQASILEQHEAKIAKNTKIQTIIAALQTIIGIVTTAILVYVAFLQFGASDRQARIAEQQNRLEYAKVAPRFSVEQDVLRNNTDRTAFPTSIAVRIIRGEANLKSVQIMQELRVARSEKSIYVCVLRVDNYFQAKEGNVTDFFIQNRIAKIAEDPAFFQDNGLNDFLIIEPQATLLTLRYNDLFNNDSSVRFVGSNGIMSQLPSGDFPISAIYETVSASYVAGDFSVPGSFELSGEVPKTEGCRNVFGLPGGETSFIGLSQNTSIASPAN